MIWGQRKWVDNIKTVLITQLSFTDYPARAKHYPSYPKAVGMTWGHLKRNISTSVKAYDNCLTYRNA